MFTEGVTLQPRKPYLRGTLSKKARETWLCNKIAIDKYCDRYMRRLREGKLVFTYGNAEAARSNPDYFLDRWKRVTKKEILRMIERGVYHGGLLIAAERFMGYGEMLIAELASTIYLKRGDDQRVFRGGWPYKRHIKKLLFRRMGIA